MNDKAKSNAQFAYGNTCVMPVPNDGSKNCGLTKRELFAAMAMQGLSANVDWMPLNDDPSLIAQLSVKQADALLNALEKSSHE